MEDLELKNLWRSYDTQLQAALTVNAAQLRELQTLKAKSAARRVRWIKWLGIALGINWVVILYKWINVSLAVHNYWFAGSAGIHMMVTVAMIVMYARHLLWLRRIDNAASVMEVQGALAQLQTATLDVMRIGFLQLPVFATFMLGWNLGWHAIFPISLAVLFAWTGVWLYRNIKPENTHRRWFRVMFNSPEWAQLVKARAFLDQIEAYKKEA